MTHSGTTHSGLSMFDLTGRVALVTGSSRGIGAEIARALASVGATVVLNSRSVDQLERTAAELTDTVDGASVSVAPADLTVPDEVTAMFDTVVQDHGRLDIVVNNAGTMFRSPLVDFPIDEARRVFDTNLFAPFMVARAAAQIMVPQGHGKIINTASVMSKLGRATVIPYAASKGGIMMLTRSLCAELGPSGIQVNAIAPGYFATELTTELVNDKQFSTWLEERTPAGRWGQLEDLGGAAIFLASDASNFVNGQILFVDGGMTAVV